MRIAPVARLLALGAAALVQPGAGFAQSGIPARAANHDNEIVVTGRRLHGPHPVDSDWRVAETPHVVVFGRLEQADITHLTQNLEKLDFVLSILLDRVDRPSSKTRLAITIFGDSAAFRQLDLVDRRWQDGPYPDTFPSALYYDPRADGAIAAVTRADQKVLLQPGAPLGAIDSLVPDAQGVMQHEFAGPNGAVPDVVAGEDSIDVPAISRLYALYAEHYLMTYFPHAYPRWYVEGFGQLFATFDPDAPGDTLGYGRPLPGLHKVLRRYGLYPVKDILNGRYLDPHGRRFTPDDAWLLTHLLFFSDTWRQPLHDYLSAIARGEDRADAAKALGDPGKLQHAYADYAMHKIHYAQMRYPADRVSPVQVWRLKPDEAAGIVARLLLGSRTTLPPEPPADADPATAAAMAKARADAIDRRADWLDDVRRIADHYPGQILDQLLLAEGECRADDYPACADAANAAIALKPDDPSALAWKAMALIGEARTAAPDRRAALADEARALAIRANHLDTEAPLPLIAYHRSYADIGEKAPDAAILAVVKANDLVPTAPATRLALGKALLARGDTKAARVQLLPLTHGAFDTPENAKARAALAGVGR